MATSPITEEMNESGAAPAAIVTQRSAPSRLRSRLLRVEGVIGVALFLLAWELFARSLDNTLILVPPSAVAQDLWEWIRTGEIFPHLKTSGTELLLGFVLGLVAGLILGVAMGLIGPVRRLLQPLVVGLYSTPVLALAPLFVIWFGFGLQSKILLIALTTVFPILVNVEAGIVQAERAFLEVARSFGASSLRLISMVRFPSAIPFVFAGMRIAIARAVTGVFVAELFGATSGIGFASRSRTPRPPLTPRGS
jgi:NitT/TauT family transport system permease protein